MIDAPTDLLDRAMRAEARAEALEDEILNLRARLTRLTEQGPVRIGGSWDPPQDEPRFPWILAACIAVFAAAATLGGVANAITNWFLSQTRP